MTAQRTEPLIVLERNLKELDSALDALHDLSHNDEPLQTVVNELLELAASIRHQFGILQVEDDKG